MPVDAIALPWSRLPQTAAGDVVCSYLQGSTGSLLASLFCDKPSSAGRHGLHILFLLMVRKGLWRERA
jgi:hypothetical protein